MRVARAIYIADSINKDLSAEERDQGEVCIHMVANYETMAEVIEDTIRVNWEIFDDRRHQAQVIARAVAEWLKGQGR